MSLYVTVLLSLLLIPSFTLKLWAQQAPAPANVTAANAEQKPANTQDKVAPKAVPSAPDAAKPDAAKDEKKPIEVPGIDAKTGIPLYETIQEDWSSLDIGASKLEPEPPLIASTDETA